MPIQIEANTHLESPIVGIDLGTTNSLVAFVNQGQPQVLKSTEGQSLVPSVVSLIEGQPIVGYRAKEKKVRDAQHTVFSVKRLLGRGFEDLKSLASSLPYEIEPGNGMVKVRVGDRTFTAIEISAMILKELKLSAEKVLGCSVTRAVVTVPAYFNDSQRQATRTAARLAGLDVLRIINEPTAAALAYGLDRKRQGLIAVYDLGGGTFDISLLKLQDGIFEVLATSGDTELGGDDFDQAIVRVVTREIQELWNINVTSDIHLFASLIEAAEKTKIALSDHSEAIFEVRFQEKIYRRDWTQEEFFELVRPILERTREPCMKALRDAGLKVSGSCNELLSDVVLVGGPTRLKVVQEFVQELFGKVPNTSMHPDEVVAQGAAIQADILAGNNQDFLLLDVVPLSLGLETYGGLMSTLISRNTKIPTVAREGFTTFVDCQTGVDIHVLQGERERAQENRSLARFKLTGIQPMPAGMPRIEVTFLIDADGILQVAAKDLKTGNEQAIEVRPSFGLTEAEVEKMLMAGLNYADSDDTYRRLVEVRNEAWPTLIAAEKRLPDAFRLLSQEEAKQIQGAIERLKGAMQENDPKKIREYYSSLNQCTVRLAELLINETSR